MFSLGENVSPALYSFVCAEFGLAARELCVFLGRVVSCHASFLFYMGR